MTTHINFIAYAIFMFALIGSAIGQNSPSGDEYIRIADEYKKNSKPDSALIYYEKASVEFQTAGKSEKFVNSYNQIGIILTRQDEYEKAKTYLEQALSKGISSLDTNYNLTLATTYISLGVIYNAEENYTQSLIYHYKALAIRLRQIGESDALVATSYGNIGNVYLNAKDYNNSIEAHLKAMKIREAVFGAASPEIIESFTNLGRAYREKKDYKTSLEYFEKALNNKIIQPGVTNKDLTKYYKNISDVYYLMNNKVQGDLYKSKTEETLKK